MRVLLISSLYGIEGGGAGVIAHHLAHGISSSGHPVSVITLGKTRRYVQTDEQGLHIYRFQPLSIYPFDERDSRPSWQKVIWQSLDIYNFHAASVLQQILEKESPDIIHIHKMRGFSAAVWQVASRLFPGRVIQTCHDYESMSPDGILRGPIGRMALRGQWPLRGYQLARARLSVGVSGITAPNAFTLNRITRSGLFPFAERRVIPNTHGWSQRELESIHQRESALSDDKIRFLFLGRLEREKGVLELCQAFLRTLDLHPSMQLDIAGWGSLETSLRNKYQGHPRINFLGLVDGDSKRAALRRTTCVVVPSIVDEVFPVVTVEAFAFGKPVIASNLGGLPELIRHGETGWLVGAGNVQALAAQFDAVAKINPLVLQKMSENCKEYSYEFTVEKVLSEYLDLYRQCLE